MKGFVRFMSTIVTAAVVVGLYVVVFTRGGVFR